MIDSHCISGNKSIDVIIALVGWCRCFVVDPSRRADAAELNERADSALNGRRSRFSLVGRLVG